MVAFIKLKSNGKQIFFCLAGLYLLLFGIQSCIIVKPTKPPVEELGFSHVLSAGGDSYCNGCCTCANAGPGTGKYKGKTLKDINFRTIDLTGESFEGSTVLGCRFDNTHLKNVSFLNAKFGSGTNGTPTSFAGATLDHVCFAKATMDSTDFQYATFIKADFRCSSIFNSKFGFGIKVQGDTASRTNFAYATIGVGEGIYLFPLDLLTQPQWAALDFSYAHFLGLSPDKFTTRNKDLTDAKIAGINLEHFDMSHCKLIRADLSNANLSFAKLDSAVCYGVNFSGGSTQLTGISAINADFYDSRYKASVFDEATMTFAKVNWANFQHASFSATDMSSIQANNCNFQNAVFKGKSVAIVHSGNFSYCNFSNANLNGVDFSGATLIHAKFENNSVLSNTNFSRANLSGVSFFNSTLQAVNFQSAQLYNANFSGATLAADQQSTGVSFDCALLAGANLSCTVSNVSFGNAVIPPDDSCCTQSTGIYCGTVPSTGEAYGHTTLPDLKSIPVRCPNGDFAACTGTQWLWSPRNAASCGWQSAPWMKPDCGHPHDSTQNVQIRDPNLKKCLQNQLFGGKDLPIPLTVAQTVSAIDCPYMKISDLGGLEAFNNLLYMNLEYNNLQNGDFSNMAPTLQTLKVSGNQLTSLTFSSAQQAVTNLEADNNKISQIKGTTNIYFQLLDLSRNSLAGDWSNFFKVQTSISYLDLSYNQLSIVGDLSKLTKAGTIYLQFNNLVSIGDISKLYDNGNGSLYNLDLEGNTCFKCNSLNVPVFVQQAFHCSCNTKTCNTCNN